MGFAMPLVGLCDVVVIARLPREAKQVQLLLALMPDFEFPSCCSYDWLASLHAITWQHIFNLDCHTTLAFFFFLNHNEDRSCVERWHVHSFAVIAVMWS